MGKCKDCKWFNVSKGTWYVLDERYAFCEKLWEQVSKDFGCIHFQRRGK